MYKIEKTGYGFKLTFADFINAEEMKKWVEDSKKALLTTSSGFHIFVDMRTLKPLPADAQQYMQEGQKLYKQKGMTRSAVILASSVTKMQFKRIAQETGIYQWERYIDASSVPAWEKVGVDWLKSGIDPDK
ncbi:hypothetical protein MASR2M18_07340 [Ignavibacteria bacterium]|nr:hypothetical protein [Bacteroidota bacterium]MCZ2132705.1 hypothetical protein [Bacteroidota bacterium]